MNTWAQRTKTYTPYARGEKHQACFAALGVVGWLAEQNPAHPVGLARSEAEMVFATFTLPPEQAPAVVSVLLLFDWPILNETVVTAASLWHAITTSVVDDAGGARLGTHCLAPATGVAPPPPRIAEWTIQSRSYANGLRQFCRRVYTSDPLPANRPIRCASVIVRPELVSASSLVRPFVPTDPRDEIVVASKDGRQALFGDKAVVATL